MLHVYNLLDGIHRPREEPEVQPGKEGAKVEMICLHQAHKARYRKEWQAVDWCMHQFHNVKLGKHEYLMGSDKAYEAFQSADNQVTSITYRVAAARKVRQQLEELRAKIDDVLVMQDDEIAHSVRGLNIAQKLKAESYAVLQAQIDNDQGQEGGERDAGERERDHHRDQRASSSEERPTNSCTLKDFVTLCNKNGFEVPDCVKQQILLEKFMAGSQSANEGGVKPPGT